jgi:enoyl-CoA hydratase
MIEVTHQRDVAILTMVHGKANALSTAFCDALVAGVRDASAARAIVITGKGHIFSAGVDLPLLLDGGPTYVREFLPALHRLYETVFFHPKPIVAAINGHAVAGGCVLACATDRRVMATGGGRIGVTELLVGVPFPSRQRLLEVGDDVVLVLEPDRQPHHVRAGAGLRPSARRKAGGAWSRPDG